MTPPELGGVPLTTLRPQEIMGSTEGDDIEGQIRTTLRDANSQRCTTCGFPYPRGFGR